MARPTTKREKQPFKKLNKFIGTFSIWRLHQVVKTD